MKGIIIGAAMYDIPLAVVPTTAMKGSPLNSGIWE
jgi:hypothetical protein